MRKIAKFLYSNTFTSMTITYMEYDMSDYCKQIVVDFELLCGELTKTTCELKVVATPFLDEDCSKAPARAPNIEGAPVIDCPCCKFSFSPVASHETVFQVREWMQRYQPEKPSAKTKASNSSKSISYL